ncbi:MAG: hypothetical protein NW214_12005 [Pseudanabaenaceae cyanobacterium bins.39]|nr:hypothetical protein [Pseudanabaenaceae cyanobacterium bins.39]
MSKAKKSNLSDTSKSKSASKGADSSQPTKDLPKLEVLKVIAPKSSSDEQSVSDKTLVKDANNNDGLADDRLAHQSKETDKILAKSAKTSSSASSIGAKHLVANGASEGFHHDRETGSAPINEQASVQESKMCLQPISPATDPFQYRAIGVVCGRYVANEDNFAKGHIQAPDGSIVDAVLLGKVISLAKKRLHSDRDYLWVVYPRTNDKGGKLHVQIAGVWAPEDLGRSHVQSDPDVTDGYFSVRGEVSSQSVEDNLVIVKIRRTEQKFDKQKGKNIKSYSKFKVRLHGLLPTDAVGQFWSMNVQRQDNVLTIVDGEFIGIVPVKGKRNQFKGRQGAGAGKFTPKRYSDRPFKPSFNADREGELRENRPPVPRPIIKRREPPTI